ncbi:alpha/beta hydrolase [Halioxenophilus sp. WMMB6]|uniref:alpha/beta hydrolase n=1 Tax=Halioxenophilus sp. WMMB6 TaxID=3073815 RepID=UPI00295F5A20|nr:alpha/beta hydrolase [Halioxenophilus sp. WMMB6]
MELDRIHPELQPTYKRIPNIPFDNWFFFKLLQLVQWLQPKRKQPIPKVEIVDHALAKTAVRVYRPQQCSGAGLLWIHGGGYIMGDVSINDRECNKLAKTLGLVVVSVDYRLAPKYAFPVPLDDCYSAWQFMLDNCQNWGVDPNRLAVLGQSAGGGLAAGLVQRIADTNGVHPAAQILTYPMLDDRTANNRELDSIKHRLWNNRSNRFGWRSYLGCDPGNDTIASYAVPARRESLTGLPPTWIGVGDLDLFYAENCRYAERLRASGIDCELWISPQCPHGFDLLAPKSTPAREINQSIRTFLSKYLGIG